ncbi:hypothetical protein FQA39_LY09796 [Lamprigera yunnana]|nr:hypothetical protein FQA39_LY09796 [Lamprigera yunnana]
MIALRNRINNPVEDEFDNNTASTSHRGAIEVKLTDQDEETICTFSLVLGLCLNISMLALGVMKKDDCPIQNKIPLYLIVAGSVGLISKLLPFINRKLDWCLLYILVSVLYLFEFIWIVLGSVWIYGIYKPNFDTSAGEYCDESTYSIGFWLLTVDWVFLGGFLILLASIMCSNDDK